MVKKQNRRGAVCVYSAIKNEIGYGACGINMGTFFLHDGSIKQTIEKKSPFVCMSKTEGKRRRFIPITKGTPL